MKSICFVGMDNYPVLNPDMGITRIGGESLQQTLLAREFVAMGYEVSMIVRDFGQPDVEERDGIRVYKTYRLDAGLPVLRFLHPRLTSIARALPRPGADLYYQSCAAMLTGLVGGYCRRNKKIFAFRVAHDSDCVPGQQLIRYWRDRKLYEYGLKRADLILVQSEHQRRLLRRHYGLESIPMNMAVELPLARPAGKRDIDILWVNNMRPFKRPELMIDLAGMLPDQRIVMIGGPCLGMEQYFAGIEQAAKQAPNLEFIGPVPYSRVNDYFLRARLFANTSESEGFPNSFLQAWIRGVPVVSFFDPDGLIQGHRLGAVPADIEQMAGELSRLLENDEERLALSGFAQQYAIDNYSPASVARQHEAVFKKLI
ncbi:MAG: glycosyltransferase family 4 protein [Desulfobacterales bacterium]|nr:glycosyltransferase family 4 protein [Desulfobacterales bacterium]